MLSFLAWYLLVSALGWLTFPLAVQAPSPAALAAPVATVVPVQVAAPVLTAPAVPVPAPTVAATPAPAASPKGTTATGEDAAYEAKAQRLRTLKRLRDENLISEAEYQEKREAILKTL